jgi:hypothetical protein
MHYCKGQPLHLKMTSKKNNNGSNVGNSKFDVALRLVLQQENL